MKKAHGVCAVASWQGGQDNLHLSITSKSDHLLVRGLRLWGWSTAASASAGELTAFAALFMGSSGLCFPKYVFSWLGQASLLEATSNSFVCCLTTTSSSWNHSEDEGGKESGIGSTGVELHLCERGPCLCVDVALKDVVYWWTWQC